jgi:hypothetical protein
MKTTIKAVLLASTLAFGLSASPIYMSTQPGAAGTSLQIGVVDPSGTTTAIHNTVATVPGGTPIEFYDIAVNSLNEIYGVSAPSGGLQQLWRINPADGVAQLIAANLSGALSTINGLAFNPLNGMLFLSGSSGTVYRTDLSACVLGDALTASCTLAAANAVALPTNSRGDIAFHTDGAGGYNLFFGAEGSGVGDRLYRLNSLDGLNFSQNATSLDLSALGGQFIVKGLASDGTNLYVGGDIFGGSASQAIALVNPSTLILSGIQPITGVGLTSNVAGMGANANAVPEPSVLLLSTVGLGMIAWSRRKTKSS